MLPEEYKAILAKYMPAAAVEPIYDFMEQYHVHLHITRKRTSKLGDYRWPQRGHNYQEISVNGDMNPYQFLMVLLHEMAHLNTHQRHPASRPRMAGAVPPTAAAIPPLLPRRHRHADCPVHCPHTPQPHH